MKAQSCKVYYSILALCYLEVLLWTTCVISSGAHSPLSEDSLYIERETSNLKEAYSTAAHEEEDYLPGAWDLRGGNLHQQLLQQLLKELQRLQEAIILPVIPRAIFCLAFIPVVKGVPGPYTGIKALREVAA